MSAEHRLAYADSSALVKLIVEEQETTALRAHLQRRAALATSRLAIVEVSRASALSNPSRSDMPARVDRVLSWCTLVDVSPAVLRDARRLASASLRTLDAIHLASAMRVQADEVVAYDARLLEAASEQRMRVVSPGR